MKWQSNIYCFYLSIIQSVILRVVLSKLIPTFVIGNPDRAKR